jgi:acetyltransferase-like isoleucine patch superfamily enzyme
MSRRPRPAILNSELLWRIRKVFLEVFLPGRLQVSRVKWLRGLGVRIGEECRIASDLYAREPFLIDIGNRVGISTGVRFITHDGAASITRRSPTCKIYGRIVVGDDTFIGVNSLILPGTVIGRNCIVGAGSVVRGTVPDGVVVMGNPARVVMSTEMADLISARNRNMVDTRGLPHGERRRKIMERLEIEDETP